MKFEKSEIYPDCWVSYWETGRFAWPSLSCGRIKIMELVDGSGDDWYDVPEMKLYNEKACNDIASVEEIYEYLRSYCR